MDITCISDLHGHYPQLEGGDLLIVAGDLTCCEELDEYLKFFHWLSIQQYRKVVFISGNHDNQSMSQFDWGGDHIDYLLDSGIEFEGLKIWGSPYTLRFPGENPKCLAFTCGDEEELAEHWECIPEDTDILVTHSPPYGILDSTTRGHSVGSESLRVAIGRIKPSLCVFGHIHESYGKDMTLFPMKDGSALICDFVNASIVNERYEPVNKPIRIEL